jgi:hypothetical protein
MATMTTIGTHEQSKVTWRVEAAPSRLRTAALRKSRCNNPARPLRGGRERAGWPTGLPRRAGTQSDHRPVTRRGGSS